MLGFCYLAVRVCLLYSNTSRTISSTVQSCVLSHPFSFLKDMGFLERLDKAIHCCHITFIWHLKWSRESIFKGWRRKGVRIHYRLSRSCFVKGFRIQNKPEFSENNSPAVETTKPEANIFTSG